MRGYRYLKESNQLDLITEIRVKLNNTYLNKINTTSRKLIYGAGIHNAELITRQFLLSKLGGIKMNKILLYSLGDKGSPLIYPMPFQWQIIVRNYGFHVARIRCSLSWISYVGLFWCYGVFTIVKQVFISIHEMVHPQLSHFGKYVYFDSLKANNLPQHIKSEKNYDIISWYYQWSGRIIEPNYLFHCVKNVNTGSVEGIPVLFRPYIIPPLISFLTLILFINWGIATSILAIYDLLRGHWWHALMLKESALSAQTRFQDKEKLAKDYMFNNSNWLYRPLWSYEVEKQGSRILFYFYSTNCEIFKRPEGYSPDRSGWEIMSWPLYLVWDEFQADFVRRAVGENINISVVGPIWFQSSLMELQTLPPKSIAIFDVQPHRDSRYQLLGAEQEYYVPSIANKFLLDIYKVLKEFDATMVLKRKRKIGKLDNRRYTTVVKNLSSLDNFISIDPDISARIIIERSALVISMPFTSTALIGKEYGKPSVYYDPTGIIQKDDRAAHGIPIIIGVNELRSWFTTVYEPCFNNFL